MVTTNNFPAQTPRKILLGPFQPALESALAAEVAAHKKLNGLLAPLSIVVPTRLLGLHLQRALARARPNGHANVRFQTLTDLLPSAKIAPPLGLELLTRRLARDGKLFPSDGYFCPVAETAGFAAALRETFKDLEQAGVTAEEFHQAAGASRKLNELAAAYTAYRRWLAKHDFVTEADLFLKPDISSLKSPLFLYGFYDLTTVQRRFVECLSPAAVFFPLAKHNAYADPLLKWFKSLGYQVDASSLIRQSSSLSMLSCPGETSEVREAVREALAHVRESGKTFADVAFVFRSRELYDAIARDTLPLLGVRAFFRGGRPLAENFDAKLMLLLLETVRSDFSRAALMELACHLGPYSHWDALSAQLGIVGGKEQWRARLPAANPTELTQFIERLFAVCDPIVEAGSWRQMAEAVLTAFRALGGTHAAVIDAVLGLAELDEFDSLADVSAFVEFCGQALKQATEQTEKFQGGGVFVGDVMSARGLSFSFVALLGLAEKGFPRVVREDPLLLDDERVRINPNLPRKLDGYDEERLLFDLMCGAAQDKLVLSYPRLDPATSRPRIPSFLLLDHTGATSFQALEATIRAKHGWVQLSPVRDVAEPLSAREFDLAALDLLADNTRYLQTVSPLLGGGVAGVRTRWRERGLTIYDGLLRSDDVRTLLRERFGLDKLVISATSLEDFFACPFYYLQKHVLGIKEWDEPEAAQSVDALDLGSLYHEILEDYCKSRAPDIVSVADRHFREFEQRGVTGYATVWEIKKQIVVEELTAFVERDRAARADWRPERFEEEFHGIAVAPPVRLRGKIDRIDLSSDGARARVLDYKTGKLPRGVRDDSLAGGEALQLPLYIVAAQRLLPKVAVESASYLYFTLRGGYRTVTFSRAALAARHAELTGLLETAAAMIGNGTFGQFATADGCRHCEYRPICGNRILKLYALKQEDAGMESFRTIKEDIE